MRRIVLVSPSGSVLQNFEKHLVALQQDQSAPSEIVIITWHSAEAPDGTSLLSLVAGENKETNGSGKRGLRDYLDRSIIGRNLVRISPWDRGRHFYREANRNPQAREALLTAEVLVAVERDAILTVWQATRRSAQAPLHAAYGLSAGLAHLAVTSI